MGFYHGQDSPPDDGSQPGHGADFSIIWVVLDAGAAAGVLFGLCLGSSGFLAVMSTAGGARAITWCGGTGRAGRVGTKHPGPRMMVPVTVSTQRNCGGSGAY